MKPITREETYLAYAAGDISLRLPNPISRKERYLYALCQIVAGGGATPEQIQNYVSAYLEENPVQPGATEAQAAQIEANTEAIEQLQAGQNVDLTGYATAKWVQDGYQPKGEYLTEHQDISGKLDADKLPEAVNSALAQAKASGEFDGKDYVLTDADRDEIAETVKAEVPLVKVAEQPTFVHSVEECTDTSKVYLMADGYLWAHMTKVDPGRVLTADDFELGRLGASGGTESVGTTRARNIDEVACTVGQPISIDCTSTVKWLVHFYQNGTWIGKTDFVSTKCDNLANLWTTPSDVTHIRLLISYTSDANIEDLSDLVGQFTIIQAGQGTVSEWTNTGLAYNQPADYEARVIAMEQELGVLLNGTF